MTDARSFGQMRFLLVFPLSFLTVVFPAYLLAEERLDERLYEELHLINQFSSKLTAATKEFISEMDREMCSNTSSQAAVKMSPSCKAQTLQHLKNLDENNQRSEEYMVKMVEGWARVYGMLRVAHAQCGLDSIHFELLPAGLRVQSIAMKQDPDALVMIYISASENALEGDLDKLDCNAIRSFTADVQQIMIVAQRAVEKMRSTSSE